MSVSKPEITPTSFIPQAKQPNELCCFIKSRAALRATKRAFGPPGRATVCQTAPPPAANPTARGASADPEKPAPSRDRFPVCQPTGAAQHRGCVGCQFKQHAMPVDGICLDYCSLMQSTRFLISCVALAALAACGSSGDTNSKSDGDPTPGTSTTHADASLVLDPTKVEQQIAQKFAKDDPLGGSLTSVSCPEEVSSSLGDETSCDIDFSDGAFGNATIKIVDDKGDFKIIGINRSPGAG